jgi:hypothetical protein
VKMWETQETKTSQLPVAEEYKEYNVTWWWTLINEDFSVLKIVVLPWKCHGRPRYQTLHPQDASGSRCPGCPTGSAQKSGVSPQPWRFHFWLQSLVKILVTGPQCFFRLKARIWHLYFLCISSIP